MQMVLEVIRHSSPTMPVIDGKEGKLGISLQIGECGAPVLVGLLVALHVGDAHPEAGVGAVVAVLQTVGLTLTRAIPLLVFESTEQLVPARRAGASLKHNYYELHELLELQYTKFSDYVKVVNGYNKM